MVNLIFARHQQKHAKTTPKLSKTQLGSIVVLLSSFRTTYLSHVLQDEGMSANPKEAYA